jgi:hypothetical protein
MIAIIKPEDAITRELEDRMNINHELDKRIGKRQNRRMARLKVEIAGRHLRQARCLLAELIHAAVTKDQEQ